MARTAAQLEQALAVQMDLRFSAKSPEVKRLAHERVEFLRGELKLQRELEARQAAERVMRCCSWCGKRQAMAFEGCWNCGGSLSAVGSRRCELEARQAHRHRFFAGDADDIGGTYRCECGAVDYD